MKQYIVAVASWSEAGEGLSIIDAVPFTDKKAAADFIMDGYAEFVDNFWGDDDDDRPSGIKVNASDIKDGAEWDSPEELDGEWEKWSVHVYDIPEAK